MNFNPSWTQVAFFALLLGAPIVAYLVAPSAATAVTGMVTTALGFIFGDRNKLLRGGEEKKEGDQ